MSEFYYSTDREEHLTNMGEKQEPQWNAFTEMGIDVDIGYSWDLYLYEDADKVYIHDSLLGGEE